MPPVPSARSTLGVAKEATKGTAVLTPTSYIPVGGFSAQPVPTMLRDEAWRGSNVDIYGSQQGKSQSEIEIDESPVFVDTIGWPLLQILGEEAVSGAGPYTHNFTSLNSGDMQPPALTWIERVSTIGVKAWPGVQLSEVTLTIDADGLVTWTGSGMGYPTPGVGTPTEAWSTIQPFAGWRMAWTLNGSAIQPLNVEITFSREIEVKKTANNSQNPYAIWVGKLGVEISGEIIAEGDTHPAALLADTQGACVLTGTKGAGATTETLTITCSKTAYDSVAVTRGQPEVHYDIALKAIANTTDVGVSGGFSPAKVTVVNARSTLFNA